MSLILEALRKSEAQRRLGQAPDLLSPMPGAEPATRRRLRGVVFAVALVAVAGIAWWLGQQRATLAPAATNDVPAVNSVAVVDIAATSPPGVAQATDAATLATTTPAATAPPNPAPVPPPRAKDKARAPDATRPAVAASARAAPPLVVAAATAESATAASIAAALPPAPVAMAPAPPAPASAPTLPSLAVLPLSARQSLPPLRVTMHVYADEAARRFAIIDGHRVGEGALLADGVMVAEIAREGVVLDVRGARYWLPRP